MEQDKKPRTFRTRKLDDLGRIVIPMDIREALGWKSGDQMKLSLEDATIGKVSIVLAQPACSLCHLESRDLRPFKNGCICASCRKAFSV